MKSQITLTNQDLLTLRQFIFNFKAANTDVTQNFWRLENHTVEDTATAQKKYEKALDGIQVTNCLKGDRKEILMKDGQRQFTEEGYAALDAALEKLLETEITIEITKVKWGDFSESEQKWFNLSNLKTRGFMEMFVEGLSEYSEEWVEPAKTEPAESNHN